MPENYTTITLSPLPGKGGNRGDGNDQAFGHPKLEFRAGSETTNIKTIRRSTVPA
jgi:hypothetical protein